MDYYYYYYYYFSKKKIFYFTSRFLRAMSRGTEIVSDNLERPWRIGETNLGEKQSFSLGIREFTRHTLNFCIKQEGVCTCYVHTLRALDARSDANRNLQPAIVKAEKMHLYVPTLYVYVYRKFDEKGRPVERKKRELCTGRHKSLVEGGKRFDNPCSANVSSK